MSQLISTFAARLSQQAHPLIEGLLAFHLTGNPWPALTLMAGTLFNKDR